ncbi:MAG: hypothetical protein A3I29_04870 [Candidatus Magasanikbacteria bacterium RIFCSPLOWO2_02_FULL_44_11]|uniref:Uncharacterized protein n=1 Tax=Candidatus Magasanikbacteria bacterium RIFCSPLOWO2_02_FULL_44_11 TaxID=1798689 RepID=A0A1F6NAA4_9BACT|nr:MAG: hypothetical protein A3I29_04870 [Candidatus Magasanikbacteria bacterium RIFCSPLOWO2_02_FULL_44_11]
MGKYDDWKRGETEALLNMIGATVGAPGDAIARAIFRGEYRITVEKVEQQPQVPDRPPFVGRVVKTITVPAYQAKNFVDAVRLGNFDNADLLGDIKHLWGKEPVGLDKPVNIDLVEFNRNWWHEEVVAWGVENHKPLMETRHTMGISAGLPNEQRDRPIVQASSARDGDVLCLHGDSDWRRLYRGTVASRWGRDFLVGFLSESQP